MSTAMSGANEWLANEFASAKLLDFRLTKRFFQIMLEMLMGNSERTDGAKSQGRHRFFKNKKVELHDIFEPHVKATVDRLPDDEYILNIQDTTGLNYHYHNSKTDRGHTGSSPNRPDGLGYWVHLALLCTTGGTPLGISYWEIWSRLEWYSGRSRDERKKDNRKLPIEEKESYRWLEGVKECEPYRSEGRTIVQVADREADIYEYLQECRNCGDAFLVRAKANRVAIDLDSQKKTKLFDAAKPKKIMANSTIKISGNSERPSKEVNVAIRLCEVELQVPTSNRTAEEASKLSPIKATVIRVTSRAKVNGKPIEWTLLSSVPIASKADAIKVVGWYALRWRIEMFFKTLKSGAKIENSRLIDLDRLSKYALMLSIKSFRVLQLTYFARERPNDPITEIVTPFEWKVIKKILFKGKGRPPEKSVTVVELIAGYGGYVKGKNRKPGILKIWEGWTRLSHIISEAETLGFK